MNGHFKQFSVPSFVTASGFLLAVVVMVSAPLLASTTNFAVPDDTALRTRLDVFGGKGGGIGSIIGGVGGLGTTAFHGHQKITLSSGQEMMNSHYEQMAKSCEKARLTCRIQQM
jgi:hypothetical protein